MFLQAHQGEFDIVVAMYHDQALLPMKMLAPDTSVNVSLGLPFVRTSVAHGTGFAVAGTGSARESNLLAAVKTAAQLYLKRKSEP